MLVVFEFISFELDLMKTDLEEIKKIINQNSKIL